MESELVDGAALVQRQQMTMDVHESKHTLERIEKLRRTVEARRAELATRDNTARNLHALFEAADSLVAALSARVDEVQRAADDAGKRATPSAGVDWERAETTQLTLEAALAPAAVALQQCENRLIAIGGGGQMSAAESETFGRRLAEMSADLRDAAHRVEEARGVLDRQLVADDHGIFTCTLDELADWLNDAEAKARGGGGGSSESDEKQPQEQLNESLLDPASLSATLERARSALVDVEAKTEALNRLVALKNRVVALGSVEGVVKHEVRRSVAALEKRMSNVSKQQQRVWRL